MTGDSEVTSDATEYYDEVQEQLVGDTVLVGLDLGKGVDRSAIVETSFDSLRIHSVSLSDIELVMKMFNSEAVESRWRRRSQNVRGL